MLKGIIDSVQNAVKAVADFYNDEATQRNLAMARVVVSDVAVDAANLVVTGLGVVTGGIAVAATAAMEGLKSTSDTLTETGENLHTELGNIVAAGSLDKAAADIAAMLDEADAAVPVVDAAIELPVDIPGPEGSTLFALNT